MTDTPRIVYRKKVEGSALRTDIKEKVLRLLDKDTFSYEDAELVRDLIQQDIDADIASVEGLEEAIEADPEYQAAVKEAEEGMAELTTAVDKAHSQIREVERRIGVKEVEGRLGL